MAMTERPELDDPRVLALAKARQQLSHEGMHNPTYDELTPQEQEGCLWPALHYLRAAIRAGLIPADTPPSADHTGVYLDDHDELWTDYPTAPPSDALLPLVWANRQTTSRADLVARGTTLRRIGWAQ